MSGKQENKARNPGAAAKPDAGAARAHFDVEDALTTALAHHRAGRLDEAEALYRTILLTAPNQADALNLLGVAVQQKGDAEQAVGLIRRAIAADATEATYYTNLGSALQAAGRLDEAATVYRQALGLDPHAATAHNNLGNVLQALGRVEEAVACYRRALDIDPDYTSALNNLGNVLGKLGQLDEAVASYRKALRIKPDFALALANLANVLHAQGKFDEAEEGTRRAVAIQPDFPMARHNLALSLLVLGDFGQAWEFFTARRSVRNSRRALWQKPLPHDLRGKRLFVLKDQGLGDEIFFLRFVPELKKRGAEIAYLADPKIGSITARLPFIDRVVSEGEEPEEVDITLSIGDLPLATGMKSAADIPPPYALPVQPERAARMEARLKRLGAPPYVGLAWRAGTPNQPGSVFKLAPLDGVAKTLCPVKATFLALQRKPEAGEIEALGDRIGRPVHDLTALNEDLEEMLALLSLIHEYVTVSNTNVHLRAATGRTSRVLVPNPPEYRWMAEGTESPWFPGCRVYRQKVDGDWAEALAVLAEDLAQAFGSDRNSR